MFYCQYCGYELQDEAKFCPKCGKMAVRPESGAPAPEPMRAPEYSAAPEAYAPAPEYAEAYPVPAPQVPMVTPEAPKETPPRQEIPAEEPVDTPSEISVFVLGIVSIVLSTSGLPGLILSLITRSKVRAREAAVGPLTGKGKVGKTLATIALPVSICFMVLWTIRIISFIFGATLWFSYIFKWMEESGQYMN